MDANLINADTHTAHWCPLVAMG